MDATTNRIENLKAVPTLDALYGELKNIDITPGWIPRPKPILSAEPDSPFKPMHWRYREAKAGLDAAGRLIDTKLAERRNLVMRNSIEGNDFGTTRTLVAAYQLILPGEKARSHRHAPHALRVIIDAKGAFSTVNGEKTPMETGDVVLTPGWSWHGHGHDGSEPAYWFDGLDVPLVHLLEPMFFEEHPDGWEKVEVVTETSPMRFSASDIAKRLDKAPKDPQGFNGRRVRLEAPTMPTIALFVARFETGEATRRCRSTANTIFNVIEGSGVSKIGGETFAWEKGDTFCAPCWSWIEHKAASDAVMFSMTDEFLQRWAHYYKFEAAA